MVTINQLAVMAMDTAGIKFNIRHIKVPQGVCGQNSDNSRLRFVLNLEPEISLEKGIALTYQWIEKQVQDNLS